MENNEHWVWYANRQVPGQQSTLAFPGRPSHEEKAWGLLHAHAQEFYPSILITKASVMYMGHTAENFDPAVACLSQTELVLKDEQRGCEIVMYMTIKTCFCGSL